MPEPIVRSLHAHFHSIDEHAAAAQSWNLEFRQLERGRLTTDFRLAANDRLIITRNRFNCRLEQRGEAPPGMITVAVFEPGTTARWHGRDVRDETVLVFRELEGVSPAGFEAYTVSVCVDTVYDVAETIGLTEVEELFTCDPKALVASPETLSAVRKHLSTLLDLTNHAPTPPHCDLKREFDFEVPAQLVRTLASHLGEVRRPRSRLRDLARHRALAIIEDRKDDHLTIRDLCRAAGASERTLEYSFREHFGMGPKAYLQATRLNAVRRVLRDAGADTKISDIANHWGFWHMGQFAADYRRYFGELPSQTLRGGR